MRAIALFYLLYLGVWGGLCLGFFGLGWGFCLGLGVAAAQAAWHVRLIAPRAREGCFKAFRLNHWVGAALFAGTVVDLWR